MSEYTPTTGYIKLAWAVEVDEIGHVAVVPDRVVQFDRWLAERDRQVAERAWDQGRESVAADMVRPLDESGMRHSSTNPYRKEQENGATR